MQAVKCFLFVEQFFNPLRSMILYPNPGETDQQIIERARSEFWKSMRIEIEDARDKKHLAFRRDDEDREIKGVVDKIMAISAQDIETCKPSEFIKAVMRKWGMTSNQVNYLLYQAKKSKADIWSLGPDIYRQKHN